MLPAYILAFCRAVIGLVFLVSFASKALNLHAFEHTIASFSVLPKGWSRPASVCFVAGEIAVAILITLGGQFLAPGFALAILLLAVFTLGLASVLARRLRVSCNCFGPSSQLVSPYDICRNLGFIVCATVGLAVLDVSPSTLQWIEWLLIGLVAAVVAAVWINLRDIAQLFR